MNTSRDHAGGDDGQAGLDATRGDDGGPDPVSSERLGRVEAELAFQDDALGELSDALGAQQMDILTLQRQVQLLGEQLAALRSGAPQAESEHGDDEPPPPHY